MFPQGHPFNPGQVQSLLFHKYWLIFFLEDQIYLYSVVSLCKANALVAATSYQRNENV